MNAQCTHAYSIQKEQIVELQGCSDWSRCRVTFYPAGGSRYVKHIDNPDGNGRRLTCILYMNENWAIKHGGQLRLYPERMQVTENTNTPMDTPAAVVAPVAVADCLRGVSRTDGVQTCPLHHPLLLTTAEDCVCDQCNAELADGSPCMSCDACKEEDDAYDVCLRCFEFAAAEEERTKFVDITPVADRFVCFWSDRRTPHEVLPTGTHVRTGTGAGTGADTAIDTGAGTGTNTSVDTGTDIDWEGDASTSTNIPVRWAVSVFYMDESERQVAEQRMTEKQQQEEFWKTLGSAISRSKYSTGI